MREKKPLILFISDSMENIDSLGALLVKEYNFTVIKNASEILKTISEKLLPDIILLDTSMQESDSFDICRQLNEDDLTKDIPIIFIAEKSHNSDETKGFETGAVDFITMPVNPVVTKARIQTHIKLKQQRDLLATLAEIDGLTGIANRRRFDELLTKEYKQALREHEPIALLMVDIDDFKPFNDHYGHMAGDATLKQVAHIIDKTLNRPMDLVARYGGEEFVCLLPNTDIEGMTLIANSVLEAIRALRIPHEFARAADILTLSIGGASVIPKHGDTPESLVVMADKRLYKAKETGRNRFVFE
ncbi:MAG: diguanylate cyclase [Gammaproteobacteria bacterium]|nr:diguanylate cyclase [Gammaproteobacteria bacterium]MDH5592377.1 diguanylate cyclase [Gammaproteobacteria bacterium]